MIPAISMLLICLYLALFLYYRKGWRKVKEGNPKGAIGKVKVSVVIAARNEADNILRTLDSLDRQSYPKEFFEIIVVDDHSTDHTTEIVLQRQLINCRLIKQDTGIFSKKQAIDKAIHAATGELILATDADCTLPPTWIETMAAFYSDHHAAFIAAPVKLHYGQNFIERFQSLDFMMLQGITASGIALDLHYMCNGANLAYPKKRFAEVNGFEGIDSVATGDDMLLMFKIKKSAPGKIFFLKNQTAMVSTAPMPTILSFLMQRRRWASKTPVYEDKRLIGILAFVYFINLWMVVLTVASFFSMAYLPLALGFLLIKALSEMIFLYPVAQFFNEKKLLKYLFLYQPMHVVYTVFIGIWSQLGKYEWKGRITK
ncbi:MAG: glycosyltransferase [Flavisolibacter sp.]|nr:glycosyltransferase [Flavisolibacter sp.]